MVTGICILHQVEDGAKYYLRVNSFETNDCDPSLELVGQSFIDNVSADDCALGCPVCLHPCIMVESSLIPSLPTTLTEGPGYEARLSHQSTWCV